MSSTGFQRARSPEAKRQREEAILQAATRLGAQHGIRSITLTDIAAAVDMHKSALLRYFETREQIFLRLTAAGWQEWSSALQARTQGMTRSTPTVTIASAFVGTLTTRPLFCDLLAQAPMNLERNVSLEQVRAFKMVTHAEVGAIVAELRRLRPELAEIEAVDILATATSMAGALWQMCTPTPQVAELYRSDPDLQLAVFDVGERLTRIVTALLEGYSD
jgi:AcrR family transcriptional regulator